MGVADENMARISVSYDECDIIPIDELPTKCFTIQSEWTHTKGGVRNSEEISPGVINWTSQNQHYLP